MSLVFGTGDLKVGVGDGGPADAAIASLPAHTYGLRRNRTSVGQGLSKSEDLLYLILIGQVPPVSVLEVESSHCSGSCSEVPLVATGRGQI